MTRRTPTLALLAVTMLAVALFFGLASLGWGSPSGLLQDPARAGSLATIGLAAAASLFSGINLGGCVRADATGRWKLAPLVALSLLIAVVPPFDDRRGLFALDEGARPLGLALVLVGSVLRVGPMFVLGPRFTWPLATQEAFRLVTTGFYRHVRHPSYLGAYLGGVGWALACRSGLGLILMALLIPAFLPVVLAEEGLLDAEYGEAYRTYRGRTWRLVPFFY